MSTDTIIRSAKVAGAIATAMLVSASVVSASATPVTSGTAAEHAPAAVPTATQAQAGSWRGSLAASESSRRPAASAPARPSRAVSARQALVAKQARFARFTTSSKATKDMRGIEKSLYRGKYYRASLESKRRCIVERESSGHYGVVNPSGAYRGAYQVSASLARGASWMMLKEHRELMGAKAAKKTLARLRSKPMNTWPRYWQDAAFHTVASWEYTGSGISHWSGGRWHC